MGELGDALTGPSPPERDPWDVLNSYKSGNHEAALVYGEPEHQDAYVNFYGPERALSVVESMLRQNKALDGSKTGGGAWYEDMKQLRANILGRQGY